MNKLLLKNRFLVLLSAAVIILAVGGGLYYSQNKTILDNGQQSQSDNGNTTAETESPDPDSRSQAQTPKNPAPAPAAPAASVNLDTPILQKSSGNNGPVPPGANIEFVCRTSAVIDCTILLTNTSNGRKIDLGQKKTQDNRQGQIGTTWIWPAEAGTWEVVARVSATGQAKLSAPQKLEVR